MINAAAPLATAVGTAVGTIAGSAVTTAPVPDTCSMNTKQEMCLPTTGCQWAEFPLIPTVLPETCTHLTADETNSARITKCFA